MEFQEFKKIARLSRDIIVTEKIDGTNSQITITDDGQFLCGSRNRWLTIDNDNFGFCKWALENEIELRILGVGTHYGEWWGSGIQRGYGLKEKRFSLFNVSRWNDETKPPCCSVVPILYQGLFDTVAIRCVIEKLKQNGSVAQPGFMKPEGVCIFHTAANMYFKKTIENDEQPKSMAGK